MSFLHDLESRPNTWDLLENVSVVKKKHVVGSDTNSKSFKKKIAIKSILPDSAKPQNCKIICICKYTC